MFDNTACARKKQPPYPSSVEEWAVAEWGGVGPSGCVEK